MVIEPARPEGALDAIEWYCFNCQTRVHRAEVDLESIVDDLPPIYAAFYADAAQHMRLEGQVTLTCPVHLVHGQRDADVPWKISLELAAALASDSVQVTLIKDGDHRLSRPADIAVIEAAVAGFYRE